MCIIYGMILFFLKPFAIFHYGIWSCDSVIVICDIPLIPNSISKNKIDWKEKKNREGNNIKFNFYISNKYVYYEVDMLLIYILALFFQLLLPDSRPMILCHVMYHVAIVISLFFFKSTIYYIECEGRLW